MDIEKIKDCIIDLLYEIGIKVKDDFKKHNKEYDTKSSPTDFLTKTDTEVNSKIVEFLSKNYPDYSIISEEADEIKKESDYSFVVDPIDGTGNFIKSIPLFHIGIGLVKNGKSILSVTYNPVLEDMFWAIKGKGAFKNNIKISVSDRDLDYAHVVARVDKNRVLNKKLVSTIIGDVYQIRNNLCSHEELSGVSCGNYDAYISSGSKPWDLCHYLLVEEAGGIVTDWNGDEFNINKSKIIAASKEVHEDLIKLIKELNY